MKDGYILKSKSNSKPTKQDLELINKLTRRTFEEDEIYSFTVILCDNDIDRDFERFTDNALSKLAELYVGKTGILDHQPSSNNQTARIFECHVETVRSKKNKLGEPYKRLIAKAYMPKCQKNENIILEIDSGIKKEVSVGCSVENRICSICGKDINHEKCAHKKGHRYKSGSKFKVCHITLDNPTDAYEWSFVAVPAQPEAGVIKSASKSLFKGGEKNMEQIIKSLNSGETITLSASECKKLTELINSLETKASEVDCYRNNLAEEVVKLSQIVEPEIGENLAKSAFGNLSVGELQAFKKAFKSKLSRIIPPSPQFAPEVSELPLQKNVQFKI